MKLSIISYTSKNTPGFGSMQCYNQKYDIDDFQESDKGLIDKVVKQCIKSGHTSVLEHWSVSFLIEGLSLVAIQQLTRHRIASYTGRSLRYTKLDDNSEWYFVPKTISDLSKSDETKDGFDKYIQHMKNSSALYYDLANNYNIPAEDARYCVPAATYNNMFVTMNARSLMNFFSERLCSRAQREIRLMANDLASKLKRIEPFLFDECRIASPKCEQLNGMCKEKTPCKKEFK